MLRFLKFLRYSPYECQVPIIVNSRHFVKEKRKIKFLSKINKKYEASSLDLKSLINMDIGIFVI